MDNAKFDQLRRAHTLALLEDFTAYVRANPGLRFWQALASWSGIPFLVAANGSFPEFRDTFHWEGKNG